MEPPTPPLPDPAAPGDRGLSGSVQALLLALLLPAGLVAQRAHPLAGLLWTECFVFLLPAALISRGLGLEPRAWLRLRRPAPTALALAPLVGAAGWLLGSALFAAMRAVAPAALVRAFDLARLFEGPRGEQLAFAAAAALLAPLCEETAFRGHLAASFSSRHRPGLSIAATAAVFALLHLDPLRGPSLLLLGALYGWVAWRSGSIWPAVAAHATNNGIAAGLALLLPADPDGAEPTLPMALAGVALGAAAVALAVAAWRRFTPLDPPPAGLPRIDGAEPAIHFRWRRVGAPLLAAAAAGLASLAAIVLAARGGG